MLTEEQKKEIREETHFALTVLEREKQKPKHKGRLEKVFSYLSNGFVLLLVGSLITSILVPYYQHRQKVESQTLELKNEAFAQFLLYTNSVWKEYYLMFPLVHESGINKETYNHYMNEISEIKLQRYDAYSKIRGVAISFRSKNSTKISEVEKQIRNYAIEVNQTSEKIDEWLSNLYCSLTNCINIEVPPNFTSYSMFLHLAGEMQRVNKLGNRVSEAIVLQIRH